jgi:hypothetical protein
MVEPHLVCLGDTHMPSCALGEVLRVRELAVNRQLLKQNRRMIPANLSLLCFDVLVATSTHSVPEYFISSHNTPRRALFVGLSLLIGPFSSFSEMT